MCIVSVTMVRDVLYKQTTVYYEISIGPKMEPCGTQRRAAVVEEKVS